MAMLGNFIWFICGGLSTAIGWYIIGGVWHLTVVGIPFGKACWRIAPFAAFPFGKELIDGRLMGDKRIAGTALLNLLWILFAGLWLALGHAMAAILCLASCVLILPILLGAPAWAVGHLNLAKASFAPLGKRIVRKEEATAIRQAVATAAVRESR